MRYVLLIFLLFPTAHAETLRLISLNPALTEILFQLDLGNNIVGTTTFSDFPAVAKKIPQVGSYFKPNIEKIVSLHPSHVLVFKEGDPSIKSELANAHIETLIYDNLDLNTFPKLIHTLGEKFDRKTQAENLLSLWTTQIQSLDSHQLHKTILIEVDHNPIFVAGDKSFLAQVLNRCGLKNVYPEFGGFQKVSVESVMTKKPDIILVVGQLHSHQNFESVKTFWKNNPSTKNAYVVEGDADTLSRLGPRLPLAAKSICEKISDKIKVGITP